MKLLVTGGAGFIGANLVRRLEGAGQDVTVIDDLSTGNRDNLADASARLVEGSILDEAALSDAADGADTIVHLAARPSVPRSLLDPVASHEANVTGTVRVLEQARRRGCHVIVASSSSVYGRNPTLPKVETLLPQPVSPYAVSKLAAESYAMAYTQSFGVPCLAFRFFNVFGPLQGAGHAYAAVIPAFIDAILGGRPVTVHGDGMQTRDFTFVDTVTEVLTSAALGRVTHDAPVNLAFGTRSSLLHVLDVLRVETGRDFPVEHVASRPGDVRDSQADSGLLMRLFPSVRPVPLEVGLRETLRWFNRSMEQSSQVL